MINYLTGEHLYGDNFSFRQIENWYKEEKEGYADLGSKKREEYSYGYHQMNNLHLFSKIKKISSFNNVLGIGSAYGFEFQPIIDKIKKLTIIEPSDQLISKKLGNVTPRYVKPEIDGHLRFQDNSFDLITCFATLHHIPNVSYVLKEMIRVLKPNGYALIREPIISMGDWTQPRKGLTKNERGIPLKTFNKVFSNSPITIISQEYCFTLTSLLNKFTKSLLDKPIYSYKSYVVLDKYISSLLSFNVHYHAKNIWQKCSPSSISYVIQKLL